MSVMSSCVQEEMASMPIDLALFVLVTLTYAA